MYLFIYLFYRYPDHSNSICVKPGSWSQLFRNDVITFAQIQTREHDAFGFDFIIMNS